MRRVISCSTGSVMPKGAIPTENAEKYGCDACEYIHDNVIHMCSDFVGLAGQDPQNEAKFVDEWKCNRAWVPILLIENSRMASMTNASVQSLRNEQVKGQNAFMSLAIDTANKGVKHE